MPLLEKIESEFKEALKAKDEIKLSTLRMLKAGIQNAAKEKKDKDLEEGDILGIINKLAKQHKESIEQFKAGGRDDLVEKERKELDILQAYLPEQLSPEAITELVKKAIEETEAKSKADMGKLMKHLMPQVKGRADGKVISQIVSQLLT